MMPVPERVAAKAAGERFYFTGKPCKNGHVVKRYTGSGLCSACAVINSTKSAKKRPWHPARTVAHAAGATRYSTGERCQNGHGAERFTCNGICVECGATNHDNYLAERPGMEAKWARERRAENPLPHRANSRRWYAENRAKAREIAERWRTRNPDRLRELRRAGTERRRTRVIGNGGSFTVADIERIHAAQRGRCAFCRKKPKRLEIDHILAVSKGGKSDPRNLQLLCPTCNKSKLNKDQAVWARTKGLLF